MITFGCAWYPEHWAESQWAKDLKLMQQAGMNTVRVAEFAWSRLECAEGQFNLDWLERAISLAAEHDMKVVIGTPTAAPPAWLTQRYPEVLAIRENGQQATHGMRCHYSPTSPIYLEFCSRIAEEMARCFGHHPAVIGWQIDNEYHSFSYDPETRRQFQQWLQAKFESLENLAERWATAYWSEDYSAWDQIPLPIGNHNPGLYLAFRQFMTDVYVKFQQVQVDRIRQYSDSRQWITHNFMKWNESYDHYKLSEDLDFASWDNYVPTGHLNHLENGAMHDIVRGFKRKNFWIMETQPGQVNWGGINTALNRGEVRTMAYHAIGHGADALLYWQWRSAPGGQEQMHGTLVAPDGNPRPIYKEIAQLGGELQKLDSALDDTEPFAEIALLHSYDDRWALDFQRHHKDFDPVKHLLAYYAPLRELGQTVDVVHPHAPLSDYKLVIAPHLNILDGETAQHLLDYVQSGGHLVLGVRSGVKDLFNALLPSRQPGALAEIFGVHVEEYYGLVEPIPVSGERGVGTAHIWAEQLQIDAPDVQTLLCYGKSNGWLDGQPAVTTRAVGSGRVTYIGAWLDDGLMRRITTLLLNLSHLTWTSLPDGIELCQRRRADGRTVSMFINHATTMQTVALSAVYENLLTREHHDGELKLDAYGVAVIAQQA